MSPSAHNLDPFGNASIERETQSSGSKHEKFLGGLASIKEHNGHIIVREAVPPAEDASAARATEDLEALHQASSGPPYSVFVDRQRNFIVFMVACAGFFSPLSANIYCRSPFLSSAFLP